MDLLFKNPVYFFKTYFNFSILSFGVLFAIILVLLFLLIKKKKRRAKNIYVLITAAYLSLLICITLLNKSRYGIQELMLNPLDNIREMFVKTGVHQLRGCLSNVILFIPFGILIPRLFNNRRYLYTCILAFVSSAIIEIAQYILHRGCAETMDVICNVIGAAIGILILMSITKIKYRKHLL